MSNPKKKPPKRKTVDLARARAALAKLDELLAQHPELTSTENQGRLATHLDDEHAHEKGDDDGSEEDGDG